MEDQASLPIGLFDSGVGGLTVMREVARLLPNEDLIYFGDTARVPYGTRSPETIVRYTKEGASFLFEKGIKLLIIACHTACSHAYSILRDEFSIPILGVIESGCQKLIRETKKSRVAVLGTTSTIRSGVHQAIIRAQAPQIEIYPMACPLFVPLIEEGLIDHSATQLIADHYLHPLKEKNIDAALLACTHYPLLRRIIQNSLGSAVSLIEPAEITARQAHAMLDLQGLLNTKRKSPHYQFYASDDPEKFSRLALTFLGSQVNEVSLPSLIFSSSATPFKNCIEKNKNS